MPETYRIDLIHQSRKSISLKVVAADTLEVKAPPHIGREQIQSLLNSKSSKIDAMFEAFRKKHLRIHYVDGIQILYLGKPLTLEFRANTPYAWKLDETLIINQNYQSKTHLVLRDFYKIRAAILHNRCLELAKMHNLPLRKIGLRFITSRWGSCSKAGHISLSIYLIMATPEVADYVIIHELAHLVHHNHSAEFWSLVASMMPGFQQHRAWLKQNSHLLQIPEPEINSAD